MLSAARRELWEEAGLAPDDLWLCGTITIDTGEDVGVGIFVLRGDSSRGEPVASKEGAPEWVPTTAVYALPLVEDLPTLLRRVLPMGRGDAPFSAHYAYDDQERLVITFAGDQGRLQ